MGKQAMTAEQILELLGLVDLYSEAREKLGRVRERYDLEKGHPKYAMAPELSDEVTKVDEAHSKMIKCFEKLPKSQE